MPIDDPGLGRVLDNLEAGIKDVRDDIHALEGKVDSYVLKTITKEEFNAYQDLRRSQARWALTTIISVLMLLAAFATLIIMSRPEVESALTRLL